MKILKLFIMLFLYTLLLINIFFIKSIFISITVGIAVGHLLAELIYKLKK